MSALLAILSVTLEASKQSFRASVVFEGLGLNGEDYTCGTVRDFHRV
jgi:hypothetical protein